ncbi:hypothetical protein AB0885_12710, partial [Streptomyces sp. NPDC005534]
RPHRSASRITGTSPACAIRFGSLNAGPRPDLVRIPDTPYDSSLWTDSDDEGLGSSHGPTH